MSSRGGSAAARGSPGPQPGWRGGPQQLRIGPGRHRPPLRGPGRV